MKTLILLLLGMALALPHGIHSKDNNDKPYKVVCYYEPGQVQPEDINPNICSHIIYSFAVLVNNTIQLAEPERDDGIVGEPSTGRAMVRRLSSLRKYNPNLTIMMGIGGWGEGSTKYSQMVRTPKNRRIFIDSVVRFLKYYQLDGIDLDWEYPGFSGVGTGGRRRGRPQDKLDFARLLKELRQAFQPFGYLLTAAVSARSRQADLAYDVLSLNRYLHFINLMTYDYVGYTNPQTGHNAPMDEIEESVEYWLEKGAEPGKLILGIPLYGHSYLLSNSRDNYVGARVKESAGIDGSYRNLCQILRQQPGWAILWDARAQVPYAINNRQWITFDNHRSVDIKLQYAIKKRLGGSMVWSVGLDDYKGLCGDGRYPLMKMHMNILNQIDVQDVWVRVPDGYHHLMYSEKQHERIYPRVLDPDEDGTGQLVKYN